MERANHLIVRKEININYWDVKREGRGKKEEEREGGGRGR